jgi:signal transduction histidine kinase
VTTGAWRPHARLATAARAFALLAITAPVLWERNTEALPFLGWLAAVWLLGVVAQSRLTSWTGSLDLVEAGLIGAVAGFASPIAPGLVAALALPPFLSGLRQGARGAVEALAAELVALVAVTTLFAGGLNSSQGMGVFTWTVTGLGLGLVAGFVHSTTSVDHDALTPYRDARALILELLDLSGGLSAGLDPVSLGNEIVRGILDDIPAAALAVHVPRGTEVTPLTRTITDSSAQMDHSDLLAQAVLEDGSTRVEGQNFAFALGPSTAPVAVVSGVLPSGLLPDRIGLRDRIAEHTDRLSATTTRLDTALLFAAFRDSATTDERRRLAREMHDGVAQDIASMGYLVDALAASPASPEQAEQLQLLRDSITTVVAEVRRSVLTLRSSVEGSPSLGSAIGSLARHLSALSGVPIKVTIGEGTTRLRPEVEAELLRIAQESLNNAVRHAEASLIRVTCLVNPPEVALIISDNGRGLQGRRMDSHGLEIMGERARLIGAQLEIGNRPQGGTEVSVRLTTDEHPSAAAEVALPQKASVA